MRVMVLIAMASLLANARCVADCAFHSCTNSAGERSAATQPPCHHKTPPANQGGKQQPCSHQILPGSQSGVSAQIAIRTISILFADCGNISPISGLTAPEPTAEFHPPPPASDFTRIAVLRI